MKTTLLIMAAGIGSRFGTGIKQLEPVDTSNHIIMDYSIHCFAKLSHTLARCGNEWYNHNKVYAGGRHGCFV